MLSIKLEVTSKISNSFQFILELYYRSHLSSISLKNRERVFFYSLHGKRNENVKGNICCYISKILNEYE